MSLELQPCGNMRQRLSASVKRSFSAFEDFPISPTYNILKKIAEIDTDSRSR